MTFRERLQRVPFIAWLIAGYSAVQTVFIGLPAVLSWDGSVYVGMGKYLFSGGHAGLWEVLRPVGLPILLGAGWKIGINPYILGQVIAVAGAALAIYFAYRLGNLLYAGAGKLAAVLVAMTPLIMVYASIPMTDIISSAFALGSVTLAVSAARTRGYVWSGVLAGLAFLFRFPHGLVFLVSGIILLAREGRGLYVSGNRRAAWTHVFAYGAGFCAIAVPFFAANMIAYGDPFLPLRAGSAIIQHTQLYTHGWTFYLASLAGMNPLVLFALVPVFIPWFWKNKTARLGLVSALLYLVVYLGYFSHLGHKELRYSLAFLPMALTLAGVGLAWCAEHMGGKKTVSGVLAICLLLGIGAAYFVGTGHSRNDQAYDRAGEALRAYAMRTGRTPMLISADPFPAAVSDARFVATLYDDWREVLDVYSKHPEATHTLIDTCTLEALCRIDAGCTDGKQAALARIQSENTVVVDGKVGACEVTLYERK